MRQQYRRVSGEAMTVAEWRIFGALMLYLLTITPIKWIGFRHFANSKPRDPAFYDHPIRSRPLAPHQNGIQALPFFADAELLEQSRAVPERLLADLPAHLF